MNRKELCRNFQRGSCQYGDRCKFIHATQQQPKTSAFGFGVQSTSPFFSASQQNQNEKPNPFGFGLQTSSHPSSQQAQPFINKWTRSSTVSASNKPFSKQGDAQAQGAHRCTDPESCRRQIREDFDHERPLWKLTCYGHNRGMRCDIMGDVSYEELRAAAYEDARKGLSLQTIVERERNMINAKLVEFDHLQQKPKTILQSPVSAGSSFLSAVNDSTSSVFPQRDVAPVTFGFSRPGPSANFGPMARTPSPENNFFSQASTSGMKSEAIGMSFGIPSVSQANKVSDPAMPSQYSNVSAFHFDARTDSQMVSQSFSSQQLTSGLQAESKSNISAEDPAIWLKGEWEIGEPLIATSERMSLADSIVLHRLKELVAWVKKTETMRLRWRGN
ncbi:zinc finger C-x8-C-x5-C-x3-H type family protein isoform X2 [Wolffia australiana]